MKDFLKNVLATIVGVVLSFFVVGFIFFIAIVSMVSKGTSNKETKISSPSIVEINLTNDINDENEVMFPFAAFGNEDYDAPMSLLDILNGIEKASKDPNVKGIFLNSALTNTGYSTIYEIRNALDSFKKSGKFIYAYSTYYDEKNYYLSSVADSIFIEQTGLVFLNGLAANVTFFKDALKKVGVEMQAVKVGDFKGAIEAFTRTDLSPENRMQIQRYVNSIYNNIISAISYSRNIDTNLIHNHFSNLSIESANDAIKLGYIDGKIGLTKLKEFIKTKHKLSNLKDKKTEFIKFSRYATKISNKNDFEKNKIAIIYVSGDIVDGKSTDGLAGSETIVKAITKARDEEHIKAIVLRVNSPGGSSLASDMIMQEIELCKAKKPIIVSMGDVAASGGYYISALADSILVTPNTLTGSIGVFGLIPNAQELIKNKIGITIETVKTGENSDFGRIDRPMTNKEYAFMQKSVNNIYDEFTNIVERGRNLDSPYVHSIAQGRVWIGTDAINNKLADGIGGLNEAIKVAAYKANLKKYAITCLPHKEFGLANFLNTQIKSFENNSLKSQMGLFFPYFCQLKKSIELKGVQMSLPFFINLD